MQPPWRVGSHAQHDARRYSGFSEPFKRSRQRLTFGQYASYSAPNFRRSVSKLAPTESWGDRF
jgi:hypothetical protein